MASPLHLWLRSKKLQNQYFIIRHGESTANVAGLIVSAPENGLGQYGLSDKGEVQVRASFQTAHDLNHSTVIVCSDFKRTVETAKIARECLAVNTEVQQEPLLRERYFGDWELGSSDGYESVWVFDALNADHTESNVESVTAVLKRLHQLLTQLEARYEGENILFVSHGDILQILQTAFEGIEPSQHRSIPHLNTAEIRHLAVS